MLVSCLRSCSAISVAKNSFQSAKSSLRWPSPRTCSSRIRVYLLCEFALQRKVRPFFLPKTRIYTKEFTLPRSEEHTSELQSHLNLVCRLLLEKKKTDTVLCSLVDRLLQQLPAAP